MPPGAEEASRRLTAAGFQKLSERQPWARLKRGGRYYFTRNASTIVAFAVGARYEAGNGFHMVGAHTDRCALSEPSIPQSTCGPAPTLINKVRLVKSPTCFLPNECMYGVMEVMCCHAGRKQRMP